MAGWTANYDTSLELTREALNRVLERVIQAMKARLSYFSKLGRIGSVSLDITDLNILDMEDTPPLGGVLTDLEATGTFVFRLFGFRLANTRLVFTIEEVEINFATSNAGLPRSIVLLVTPAMRIIISFPQTRFIMKWLLNRVFGPLISLGVWLAFRIIKKVEIPVWEIVDIFAALGLRFAKDSPLLTSQKTVSPDSLLIGTSFNLTGGQPGIGSQLARFIPANTNVGAAVHERVVTAGVQTAFVKGWVPSRFHVGKWKIYINSIGVSFEQDTIVAAGQLKAKRGKCWCRVKAKITFRAEVKPQITDSQTPNPKLTFQYKADINTQISTSGMLVVLGVIMFAPVFLALTITFSHLINLTLNQFLPFQTTWSQQGLTLTIQANSVNFQGFVPLSMNFPLNLSGTGSYDISKFQQFTLPGKIQVPMDIGFTDESLAIQQDELRAAVEVKA
ncbi:MAG: hypothetical protein SF052_12245 [Bacteroidia bacterium]|nr:hypothetical protein [Bacteroidia bacterium]